MSVNRRVSPAAYDVTASTLPWSRPYGRLGNTGDANHRRCPSPGVLWSRSLGPSSIPSLGDGVMLGTAWIDRPVDTRGCTPASTSLPCSMEVQPCPCHLRPVIRLRH